jgi:hypothetical protein
MFNYQQYGLAVELPSGTPSLRPGADFDGTTPIIEIENTNIYSLGLKETLPGPAPPIVPSTPAVAYDIGFVSRRRTVFN